jgi:hypothetical protein
MLIALAPVSFKLTAWIQQTTSLSRRVVNGLSLPVAAQAS